MLSRLKITQTLVMAAILYLCIFHSLHKGSTLATTLNMLYRPISVIIIYFFDAGLDLGRHILTSKNGPCAEMLNYIHTYIYNYKHHL